MRICAEHAKTLVTIPVSVKFVYKESQPDGSIVEHDRGSFTFKREYPLAIGNNSPRSAATSDSRGGAMDRRMRFEINRLWEVIEDSINGISVKPPDTVKRQSKCISVKSK